MSSPRSSRSALTVPALVGMLEKLPQASRIEEIRALDWAASALANDPDHALSLVSKLEGFGGSDMGVLVYAHEGVFHPFSDARAVTRAKLLMDPVDPVNSHVRRGGAIEPIARAQYRARLEQRGGRVREDLLEKVRAYRNGARSAQLPWLIGNIDDIVEEGGKVYVVDYKSPSSSQYQDLLGGPVPHYHEIQLHHYHKLAELAGVQVDGLRLFAFSSDEWDGHEREVRFDSRLVDVIVATGNRFWNEFVMEGKASPEVTVNRPQDIEDLSFIVEGNPVNLPPGEEGTGEKFNVDGYSLAVGGLPQLRQQLLDLGAEVFGQAMLKNEAERAREALTKAIQQALPLKVVPTDVSRIDLGPVRLKVDWTYQEDRLLEATRHALGLVGQGDAAIEAMLDADNFHRPATWSADTLIQLLKERKGIDVLTDPDFEPAMTAPRTRRLDTLAALLKDLEKMLPQPVEWAELVDYDKSKLGVEVVRAPTVGFGKELREETLEKLRQATGPVAKTVGLDHAQRLRQAQHQQSQMAPPPRRPRRSP